MKHKKQIGLTLIELMVVIAILGILLSLAVPAYREHIVRTKVVEGFNLASAAKIAVIETVMTTQILPENQERTGYTSPSSTANVRSVTIGPNGVITISYTPAAGGGTILWVPTIEATGELTWACDRGTLPIKYRPSMCREGKRS